MASVEHLKNKVETPRPVLVALQKIKSGITTADMNTKRSLYIKTYKIFLNTESYPYGDLNMDFKNIVYAIFFCESNYYLKSNEPIVSLIEFAINNPLIHVDCCRQREVIQSNIILRIELETQEITAADTREYCFILNEKDFFYNHLTKIVQQY